MTWPADNGIQLTVTVSSDRTDHGVDVPVRLVVPPGWHAAPADFHAHLMPGEYVHRTVRVTPPRTLAECADTGVAAVRIGGHHDRDGGRYPDV